MTRRVSRDTGELPKDSALPPHVHYTGGNGVSYTERFDAQPVARSRQRQTPPYKHDSIQTDSRYTANDK